MSDSLSSGGDTENRDIETHGRDASGGSPETDGPAKRSNVKVLAVLAVVAVVVGALVILFASAPDGEGEVSGELIGSEAPGIQSATTTGEAFDLADTRGSWTLVNFFATWCPPCVAEHPELVVFSERNADSVEVISVAFDEPPEVIEEFFAEHGGDWPVLAEDTGGIVLDYGVIKLPESFLITPDGVVVKKLAGGVTADGLESLVAEYESTGQLESQ